MAKLVLFLTDGTTLDVALDRERVSIGRRTGNDVCLPYPAVSGTHALVVTLPTGSVLEDLDSTNGTFVNGKRITKYFLHDRDSIDVGRQKLVYCADNNAVDASVTPWRPARLEEPGAALGAMTGGSSGAGAGRATSIPVASDASIHTNTTVRLGTDTVSDALAAFLAGDASNADLVVEAAGDSVPSPPPGPLVRVLTGSAAGRVVPLDREEVLLGRIGVQVAAVRNTREGFRLVLVEGATPPHVNNIAIPPDGALLGTGDVAEIAGAEVEFVGLERPPELRAGAEP